MRTDAILITHAHGDHINRTTYELSYEGRIPLYCNRTTWEVAKSKRPILKRLEMVRPKLLHFFKLEGFRVGDLSIRPFRVSHKGHRQHTGSGVKDHAGSPVGFVITHKHRGRTYGVGYATDLGHAPNRVIDNLIGTDVVVIEANHNVRKVHEVGLPHRFWILSKWGHLSNDAAGRAVVEVARRRSERSRLLRVVLAHISRTHNSGEMAKSEIGRIVRDNGIRLAGLHLTYQDRRSTVIEVDR